jgi:hypothetical protein
MKTLTLTIFLLMMWPGLGRADWATSQQFSPDPSAQFDAAPWPDDKEENEKAARKYKEEIHQSRTEDPEQNLDGTAKEVHATAHTIITGTALEVVPNGESLTIGDAQSHTRRLLRANKNDLINITPGEKLRVTLQDDDATRAQSIQQDSNF